MALYLTFQLYGPLQAYGLVAVGEVRLSASHPTRSAVFGLLGAALGVRREEEERLTVLADSYDLAVRTDLPGTPLLDFHTVQTPPERRNRVYRTRSDELGGLLGEDEEPYTILSRRGYLCDACFTACLRVRGDAPPHTLEALAEALRRPAFTPYLGRKSCPPGLPFHPQVGEHAGFEEALAVYGLHRELHDRLRRPDATTAHLDTAEDSGALVRDLTAHHGRRLFVERREASRDIPAAKPRGGDDVL
ncbi:CRISPR system Cascade subunit CasD [Fundidesulfovibrio magnetotacticus]|uniref:CRISPR system Cascade subunit CasD n=1 Tax=Fundidesulfovibrio magnetotacticus TaxID=2730080 RepID=A0A6V8LRX0_9BACT|nr:type I-E CRISPR-associated protein Cas5/CasD [Fundidesulfovibrio magnetotacticus]GFK93301.1 CRISPR system Cascade subunit CasD [Fundidesulfovibrio magnetotacticus]